MTALASATHYLPGALDSNMVQEVHGGYDAYAMLRGPNASYNMNLGALGYNSFSGGGGSGGGGGQQAAHMPYTDYSPYQNNLQADATSWPSMYPSTSVSPPTTTSRHGGSVLLDHEWPAQTQYVGNVTLQPHDGIATSAAQMQQLQHHIVGGTGSGGATPTGSGSNGAGSYGYRGSGCLPTIPTEYGATSSSTSGVNSGLTPSMTPSPTPGSMMGGSPPGGSGGSANRQNSRPPYDWMKKVAYPSTPSTVRGNELGSMGLDNNSKTRTKDKYRVVYTDHQRLELEKEFHYSRYITIRRKAELAQSLALSERQVKIWFQNRRAKERKQNKKREEAMGITGIKSERQDPMSPVNMLGGGGGVCGGVEGNAPSLHMGHLGHQGQQQQQQQMSSQQILGAGVVVAPGAGSHDTTSLGVLQGPGSSGPHTPPMSTHSPPMTGHHS